MSSCGSTACRTGRGRPGSEDLSCLGDEVPPLTPLASHLLAPLSLTEVKSALLSLLEALSPAPPLQRRRVLFPVALLCYLKLTLTPGSPFSVAIPPATWPFCTGEPSFECVPWPARARKAAVGRGPGRARGQQENACSPTRRVSTALSWRVQRELTIGRGSLLFTSSL